MTGCFSFHLSCELFKVFQNHNDFIVIQKRVLCGLLALYYSHYVAVKVGWEQQFCIMVRISIMTAS